MRELPRPTPPLQALSDLGCMLVTLCWGITCLWFTVLAALLVLVRSKHAQRRLTKVVVPLSFIFLWTGLTVMDLVLLGAKPSRRVVNGLATEFRGWADAAMESIWRGLAPAVGLTAIVPFDATRPRRPGVWWELESNFNLARGMVLGLCGMRVAGAALTFTAERDEGARAEGAELLVVVGLGGIAVVAGMVSVQPTLVLPRLLGEVPWTREARGSRAVAPGGGEAGAGASESQAGAALGPAARTVTEQHTSGRPTTTAGKHLAAQVKARKQATVYLKATVLVLVLILGLIHFAPIRLLLGAWLSTLSFFFVVLAFAGVRLLETVSKPLVLDRMRTAAHNHRARATTVAHPDEGPSSFVSQPAVETIADIPSGGVGCDSALSGANGQEDSAVSASIKARPSTPRRRHADVDDSWDIGGAGRGGAGGLPAGALTSVAEANLAADAE